MEIKFLKAGTGDSILIHHKTYNIIIDGGNDSNHLLSEIDKIHLKGEVIDLLIITHHDDDHIRGILDFLKLVVDGKYGNKSDFVKKVIFNSPRLFLGFKPVGTEGLLSYKQAHDVEELLLKIKPQWEQYTDESPPIIFDDLQIDFLAPAIEDLKKYSENNGVYLSSDFKCDWKEPMHSLDKYINDSSQDKSISNKSSVVIKLECENKKILLTGDVTPDRLEIIIDKLVGDNESNPIYFDYIKLPHHGSYRSLNKNIVEKIKCFNYIISTNGHKHYLPNKRAFLKILKFLKREKEPINFIFNYGEIIETLEISNQEKRDYNFSVNPNNQSYGISI